MIQGKNLENRTREKGSAMILCLLVIFVLTAMTAFGLRSATFEVETSWAERREKNNFFNAETGLNFAISNFKLIYENKTRTGDSGYFMYAADPTGVGVGNLVFEAGGQLLATTSFPTGSVTTPLKNMPIGTGGVVFNYAVLDPDDDALSIPVARIEIKAIVMTPTASSSLSGPANNVPQRFHLGPAPHGYNNLLFASRNYCITSTALKSDGTPTGSTLQCGVTMAALRSSVAHLQGL